MSAVRNATASLVITDGEGDRLRVDAIGSRSVGSYAAFVTFPGRQASVGIDHADGLELLSFLADALGVTGTEPTP